MKTVTANHNPDLMDESDKPLLSRDKPLGWLLLLAGFVAWIASGALILDRLKIYEDESAVASCDINSWIACGEVMRIPQAEVFGFPNPFIGLVAFSAIITVGLVLIAGAKLPNWFWIGLQVGVTLGMSFVIWFWYTALFTIGILCPYCMAVWAMMIPMFLWVASRNVLSGVIPAVHSVQKIVAMWTTPAVIALYFAVIVSIVARFGSLIFGSFV